MMLLPFFPLLILITASISPIFACSDCKPDCSVNKYKCADESPLCARLEPLCENFFFNQWKEMRCACPKTCKLCTTDQIGLPEATDPSIIEYTPMPEMMAMEAPARCDPNSYPIDVGLVIDGSGSITRALFDQQILGFAKNFARQLGISRNGHRLGVVQYSGWSRTEIRLDQFTDADLLETAIHNIRYMGSGTRTGAAIDWARQNLFDFYRNASKACIVLTDGVSSDLVQNPANELRQRGVHMIAIGVGPNYNRLELDQIADNPNHVYTVDTFQNLNSTLAERLNAMICRDAVNQRS